MRHSEIVELLSVTIIEDELGNQIEQTDARKVYANPMRVTTKERYEAATHGLKPSKRFELYSWEYNDEPKLKHDDIVYTIIDVDERGEKVRITCERDIGDD